jgi:hypothetical protein
VFVLVAIGKNWWQWVWQLVWQLVWQGAREKKIGVDDQ